MPKQRIDLDDVVTTAVEMVDQDGLDELVLARVADDLGVKASALYNHVEGVDGLRQAVAGQAAVNLSEALRDAAIARSETAALRAVAAAYRHFARTHPGQYASLLLPGAGSTPGAPAPQGPIIDVLTRVLESFGRSGDEAVHGARIVRSAIHGFVTLEAADSFTRPQDLDASFEALVDFLVDGLTAGRSDSSP